MELNISENYQLKNCTSFRVGGPADRLITVNSKDELLKALEFPRPMILGNGTAELS